MKNEATSFAPGHISGFFEPVYDKQDVSHTGSCGAGINISLGAKSKVKVKTSNEQNFETYINRKKCDSPLLKFAMKYLLGERPLDIRVDTKLDLPLGQGFGMSSASVLSTTYALSDILNIPKNSALTASHLAEVKMKTGLSDVLASSFGGLEIRKKAGLPPWGFIEHIPARFYLVLCILGGKMDTKKILSDQNKMKHIINYGKFCTQKLLENPSAEKFFNLSQFFTKKTDLADKKVIQAIEKSDHHGTASMCMLGNSIFAMGETRELCKILSKFGKTFVCTIDEIGARVIS